MKKYLMYIMDPYCGWCYANSKNILELSKTYQIEIIPAGMWSGANARTGHEVKDFITKGSRIVTARTGVQFTSMYFDLLEKNTKLDSEIPSRAINVIKKINPKIQAEFTHNLLHAHYFDGKDLNILQTYHDICTKLKIDFDLFHTELENTDNIDNTQYEFNRAYQLAKKYPTFIAVSENGDIELVEGNYNLDKYKIEIERILSEE
jgi:putative protein-disulfide isomerase